MKKIVFTDKEIAMIKEDYLTNNMSCEKIGKKFGVSKRPINQLLKKEGVLREGVSNGKKIELSEEQKENIKKLYLEDNKNAEDMSKILQLTKSYIDKYLSTTNFRRSVGESISLRQTGKKRSEKVRKILKSAQQKLSKSGKRKQKGGVCKRYVINGIECQGTYEKFYIEKLIQEGDKLPKNTNPIETPYGMYYPDFSFDDKLIEIKSEYTYEVLIGKKISGYTKKIENKQYKKIKWINDKVKKIEIIIVDKRNKKLLKKEIK